MSPYPSKPKSPNPDTATGPVNIQPVGPAIPVGIPQAVGGAPRLPGSAPSFARKSPVLATPAIETPPLPPVGTIDWNRPMSGVQTTVPGAEMWATPRANAQFTPHVAMVAPHPFTPDEILTDHPQAVDAFKNMLLERRKTLSDKQLVQNPFWRRFDEMGSAFVAKLIGDVMGVLQQAQLQQGSAQLSDVQQQWVQNHPLTKWMNFI